MKKLPQPVRKSQHPSHKVVLDGLRNSISGQKRQQPGPIINAKLKQFRSEQTTFPTSASNTGIIFYCNCLLIML